MKRTVLNIPIADNKVRVRVRLESDDCEPDTQEFAYHRQYLLTQIVDQPMLVDCGLKGFDVLTIRHNGFCWVADAEAVITST
jgi:hypothetical protein